MRDTSINSVKRNKRDETSNLLKDRHAYQPNMRLAPDRLPRDIQSWAYSHPYKHLYLHQQKDSLPIPCTYHFLAFTAN